MKKLLIAISILFVMSGCGENTEELSCSSTTTANGVTTETTYNVKHNKDNVKFVTITYDYNQASEQEDIDGLNADLDGLDNSNDTNKDLEADDVVDGVVGDAIDETVDKVKETVLDLAGIKNRYENQLSMYDNINGFSYKVDVDSDTEYKIIYEIDMDKISDNDLAVFDITRDFSDIKANYEDLGYTCK